MRRARALLATSTALLALTAAPALAGAPSFECRVGTTRLGLDTHRSVALVRRSGAVAVQRSVLESVEADGVNQRYRLVRGAVSGSVDVRGAGSAASMDVSIGRGAGQCAFVPGDFALGTVTVRRVNVRVAADASSDIAVVLHRGSFVWLDPTATQGERDRSDMVRVRVVLRIRGGAAAGGEQHLGMGAAAGLDGRSIVIDGWAATRGIDWTGPPGP